MKWHGRSPTIAVSKLLMGAALPNLDEAQLPEERDDLARLQDRNLAHRSRHFDGLGPDEHALEAWRAIFEKHLNDLLQIGLQFVQRRALAVGAGKTRHPPHVQPGVRVSFDDGSEMLHPCPR